MSAVSMTSGMTVLHADWIGASEQKPQPRLNVGTIC